MQRGQSSESDTWTDEKIIRAVESAPYLGGSDDKLVQISEDTVVKLGRDWDSTTSEALAMELVRKQTRIAVPRKRRAIHHHHPEGNGLIVMDLIRNSQQLRVAWPSLSFFGKLKVVLTMRLYLRQLRRIQYSSSNTPGPPGPRPLPCNGLQFGYDAKGPFPTTSALETYFRNEHSLAEDRASRGWAPSPNCEPLDTSAFASLVFTHNDLNMRNLLLDDQHVLWVVDWGFSGFYPPWLEYLGMIYASQKDQDLESWKKWIGHMAEPAFKVEEWMKRIGYGFFDL
ncbi:hypothetical protein K443DRAFT_670892 [Laccaria amethystina LaAM-08-1]|uniref:Aminoglycoside phosphotransferase domain-containing protein n=1 Tax=Laccaria amethystina LaAM-08-1 TaxID=1095629 RepID=A0A0C9XZ88_9AGAR|nr:hypothetical protein K443DRAFT_670892 [Laccaria amethystina LaAM-08-1]